MTAGFVALRLGAHRGHEPFEPTVAGLCWSEALEHPLGVHDATLRDFDADGGVIPSPPDSALAEQARARAEAATAEAATERARAERLAAQLRALGVEPGCPPDTNLTVARSPDGSRQVGHPGRPADLA